MLSLEEYWVWDSWYLHDGDRWHCWFLKAPKSIADPELRHWNVSHGHAVSDDLVHWQHLGTSIKPSDAPAWDDYTTWTGCVVPRDDGRWQSFYTGTCRSENGKLQRIGQAISPDLETWERVDGGLCLDLQGANAECYETDWQGQWHDRAMRDPWVMKDPDSDDWLMFFTARSAHVAEANDAGCIGFATSADLNNWQLQAPVFTGGWGQLEVPQVFEYQGYWYCLFCMDPLHQAQWNIEKNGPIGRGNHYLMADHPRGPWRLPDGAGLDTKHQRYAARIVEHDGLKILGFKDGEGEQFGGYIMDPAPVFQRSNGLLSLEP
ncbi:MAG: hypothetical protein KTR32_12515 [Granulosicoccus sp.]|nr:hypothetical protein [Granulosicoccus sp.]